jgi:ketosteroid isomerase-like protein
MHADGGQRRPLTKGTTMNGNEQLILGSVLDSWKSAVDAHDFGRVASYFTDDAIFQGLHPYSVGPKSVAEYYASQPIGMTAAYTILETRRLAGDLVLGYLGVDFAFTDRPVRTVYLSLIVRRTGDGWFISHYQVSQLA